MADKTGQAASGRSQPREGAPSPARRRRFRWSYLWALLFTGLIAAWMLSGEIIIGGEPKSQANTTPAPSQPTARPETRFKVRVRSFVAEPREARLVVRGRTEAEARVEVRAETAGMVEAMPVAKGARVKAGTVLCRLEMGAREAALREAEAQLAQAKLDHEASEQLVLRGHTAKLTVAANKAKRDAAQAALERAQIELARTEIKAAFDGIVEEQPAKPGSYLSIGGACAKLVALDPLTVAGAVSEREVGKLKTGMTGTAKLVTGETVDGKLTYIAPAADDKTRTFRIELKIPNPDGALRDGVTSDIEIPLAAEPAHKVPPAILTLNEAGTVGVRAVEDGDTVRFRPVTILSATDNGVWVAGLPQTIDLITVGQDYVTDGQKVEAVKQTRTAAP